MNLYTKASFLTSRQFTKTYSTSFSFATSMFNKDIRRAIYGIYGFVRVADEIVDTFHEYDKTILLSKFEQDYYNGLNDGISLNPIINAFIQTVKKYNISDIHIQAFLTSMKMDVEKKTYVSQTESSEYIYGSADVVGLMCLKVFCNGNDELFKELEIPAMKLGSAFQKVNFLRDLKYDINSLNRFYFPELIGKKLDNTIKHQLIKDIENDFTVARQGIKKLPGSAKLSVLIAYYYYHSLLNKLKHTPANKILESRIRISNIRKIGLFVKVWSLCKLKMI